MKRLILSIVATLLITSVFAAKDKKANGESKTYKIQVTIPEMKNDSVYLGFYLNGKTYSKDTAVLNNKGVGFFTNIGKGEKKEAYDLWLRRPKIEYQALIKERYPSFVDCLRDLDDALCLIFLYSKFPAHEFLGVGKFSLKIYF